MKRYLLLTTALMLGSSSMAFAQTVVEDSLSIQNDVVAPSQPTEVFGEAATAQGGQDAALVEQAVDATNPLGNPIPNMPDPSPSLNQGQKAAATPQPNKVDGTLPTPAIQPIEQESEQGVLQPGELALPQPSDKIENELYQSGNDIIDVQAYPIDDVSTVTEPNLQPTIVAQ